MRLFSLWLACMLSVVCLGESDQLGIRLASAVVAGILAAYLVHEV